VLRSVDPSRIESDELSVFHGVVEVLRQRWPEDYQRSVKIAVLHHHVTPFIPEEVKQFELLLNAGQFKKQLVDAGFQVVLHGHKHWPDMLLDSAISDGRELLVISGGTIGGGPAEGKPGFNWLRFERSGDALSVHRHFVPVGSDSPEDAITSSLKRPLQSRALKPTPLEPVPMGNRSLEAILRAAESALLARLATGKTQGKEKKVAFGWNNYLTDESPSILGTAYVSSVLCEIDSKHSRFVSAKPHIISYLKSMRRANGYWSSTANREPGQPLETAIVLNALLALGDSESTSLAEQFLRDLASDFGKPLLESTYGAAYALRLALAYLPDAPIVEQLTTILASAACYDPDGRVIGWSPSTGYAIARPKSSAAPAPIKPTPTVAHSAAVLHALTEARASLAARGENDALPLESCSRFILAQRWELSGETIPELEGRSLIINHVTPASTVTALLKLGVPPETDRIRRAVRAMVDEQRSGLWDFGTVRKPSWCTLENVVALNTYAAFAPLTLH
jgi:hypothetical protein